MFECSHHQMVPSGDHVVLIGRSNTCSAAVGAPIGVSRQSFLTDLSPDSIPGPCWRGSDPSVKALGTSRGLLRYSKSRELAGFADLVGHHIGRQGPPAGCWQLSGCRDRASDTSVPFMSPRCMSSSSKSWRGHKAHF